jgi:hypothetical protein
MFVRLARFLRWTRRIEAGSMTITVHSLDQAGQHAANLVQCGIKSFVLFLREQPEVTGKQQKILQFTCRSGGEIQELTELGLAASRATFRDVGRDRSRRSPHLAGNAIPLRIRERASRHVDAQDKRMTPLPYPELLEILHSFPEKVPFQERAYN